MAVRPLTYCRLTQRGLQRRLYRSLRRSEFLYVERGWVTGAAVLPLVGTETLSDPIG